jgi:hypothetical protein
MNRSLPRISRLWSTSEALDNNLARTWHTARYAFSYIFDKAYVTLCDKHLQACLASDCNCTVQTCVRGQLPSRLYALITWKRNELANKTRRTRTLENMITTNLDWNLIQVTPLAYEHRYIKEKQAGSFINVGRLCLIPVTGQAGYAKRVRKGPNLPSTCERLSANRLKPSGNFTYDQV